jgi:hypothetical protein
MKSMKLMQPNTIPLEQITGDLTQVEKGKVGATESIFSE